MTWYIVTFGAWSWASFGAGAVGGLTIGLLGAGLLGMAKRGDVQDKINEAWMNGLRLGAARPGESLRFDAARKGTMDKVCIKKTNGG